jgi:hypothetical protein
LNLSEEAGEDQANIRITHVPLQIPTGYHLKGNKDFFFGLSPMDYDSGWT